MIRPRETALVAQVPSHALAARFEAVGATEITKGCEPALYSQTVALEPAYAPLRLGQGMKDESGRPCAVIEDAAGWQDMVRLRIWISPERAFQWVRCESFLKQLSSEHLLESGVSSDRRAKCQNRV